MNMLNWICEMLDQATFKTCFATVFGCVCWLLGGWDLPVKALVVLYLGDYALGFGRALYHGEVSFERIRMGLIKFVLYCTAVMMAHMLDLAVDGAIPMLKSPVRDFVICYLAVCEFLSVSVHLAAEGVRMPEWLIGRVRRFRDMADRGHLEEINRD